MPDSILEWGIDLIIWLQGFGMWLAPPLNLFTFLGNVEFYLLILPVLYWCVDGRFGLRVTLYLMLGVVLNEIVKMAIHDPRPYWLNSDVQLWAGAEHAFGIPSGHAQNSLLLWGLIAAHTKKAWAWGAAILLTLLIGFSRIYLGVHFPTDVLAGWLIGATMLAFIIRLEGPVLAWLVAREKSVQVAIVVAISVCILLIGVAVQTWVSSAFVVPEIWVQNAAAAAPHELIEPYSLKNIILGSVVFGASAVTAILYAPQARFNAGGSWSKRIGRYIVGMLGVILLFGASEVMAGLLPGETALGVFLQVGVFVLIGAWVLALGPLLFVKVGLAERREKPASMT